ncbi:NADP-dependent oxidoreductase [Streptomyces sp. 8K308]|uniref:NADP-dependent oxidoreductase n=1 Tax=Streptomyces sp. 8K308 TaxID=2530388 RepID=UPI00140550F1|nr:NADP-dependent oxidoreductase [Streptomyces sp. 8K308]
MRAIIARSYGGPDVLEPKDVPVPEFGPGDVLVRVLAAGTNPADWECRSGQAAAWFDDGPYRWGWDISGVVESVGADVTDLAPGDEVYGMPRFPELAGGYAEYVSAPAAHLAAKPTTISHLAAAALPLAGLTAAQVLDAAAADGRRVLVNGAAGGVGHLAVQLAKARGCHVTAVARETNHRLLRSLGADVLVDHTTTRVADSVRDIDVVVDLVGDDDLLATVNPGGVIAPIPGAAAGAGPLEEAAAAVGVRVIRHVVHPDGPRLAELARLVDAGSLYPEVSVVLPLEQARLAHELMENGRGLTKVVLDVAGR